MQMQTQLLQKRALAGNGSGKQVVTFDDIAEVAHEVNRAYCNGLGDRSQVGWEEAEKWQQESSIHGVIYLAAHPEATPKDLHIAWCRTKRDEGWVWGKKKDADKKTHPCMLPYEELPKEQQIKDALFQAVVKTLFKVKFRCRGIGV